MSRIIKSNRVVEIYEEEKEIEEPEEKSIESDLIQQEIKEILDNAREKANKIIKNAEDERNNILNEIQIEKKELEKERVLIKNQAYEEGKEEGYDVGYDDGYSEGYEKSYSEGTKRFDKKIDEILYLKEEYKELKNNIIEELEPDVIELISEIVEKVIGNRIETDEKYILELVSNGIKNLDPTTTLTIITSKKDYDVVMDNKDRILAEASLIDELDIKYDINYSQGDCVLETNKGNIDLSVKDQVEEVKVTLKEILNN